MLGWFLALVLAAPPAWHSIVASPAGAVAVSDGPAVRLTHDHGATWTSVLAGEGVVDALALAADGSLYVSRGQRLGVRTPRGLERWTRLPGRRGLALVANGGRVAWLADGGSHEGERWYVSIDDGATFRPRVGWSVGNNHNALALAADGRVQLMWGVEAPCGGGYQARALGRAWDEELAPADFPLDRPYDWMPHANGWVFTPGDCGASDDDHDAWCAVSPAGELHRLPIAFPRGAPAALVASEGPRVWLLAGGRLAVARGRGARPLTRDAPVDAAALAVANGEPWVLTTGARVLAYRDGAWVDVSPSPR